MSALTIKIQVTGPPSSGKTRLLRLLYDYLNTERTQVSAKSTFSYEGETEMLILEGFELNMQPFQTVTTQN